METNTQDLDLDIFAQLAEEDLSQIDTSFPILAAGQYEFAIKEITKNTSDKGYTYLRVNCNLISDALDTNGLPVHKGYPLSPMIGLTPSDKSIEEVGLKEAIKRVKADVVRFLQALGDLTLDPTLEKYKGMTFFAKTRVSKERTDKRTGTVYPPAAEIASYIPVKTAAADNAGF